MHRVRSAGALLAIIACLSSACSSSPGTAPSVSGSPSGPQPSATQSVLSSPTPTPTPTPAASPPPPPPPVHAVLAAKVPLALGMAVRRGDPTLYVVSRNGRVWGVRSGRVEPQPVLDVSDQISLGGELGLLGLAFSPDGRYAYVNYTDHRRDTNIVEFAWRDGRADMASRRRILFAEQKFPNHKGGNLGFGPDGYLYIGLGDGGSNYRFGDPQGDPYRNGQNLGVLLGKMLRIEPRMPDGSLPPGGRAYAIPPDNPFVHRAGARPEIWAYGLRNPWRWSFDRSTGDLWIGDVGAGAREEVDLQPAGSAGGQNYGWNAMEGTVEWRSPPPDAVGPVYEYAHIGGRCAIDGGYVYRGGAISGLDGWYVFGDYCTGAVSGLRLVDRHAFDAPLGPILPGLVSFGQDQRGELYALSLSGGVYRLEP